MLTPFSRIKHTDAYQAIKDYYGDRVAERSRVPLIQHIDDGLVVLDQINATLEAMKAFCLHPLFQADQDLALSAEAMRQRLPPSATQDAYVMLLVMEYRNQANAWLSDKVGGCFNSRGELLPSTITCKGMPTPGPLEEVHHMLIADKVQNYKDFQVHHAATHARSAELVMYFEQWLLALDVDQAEFMKLCDAIERAKTAV